MDFLDLLKTDAGAAIDKAKKKKKAFKVKKEDAAKQFDVLQHDVFDSTKRPDKLIKQYRGEGKNGPIYETTLQSVTRIGVPYQKLIVERLVGIMLGNKIQILPEFFENDLDSDKQKSKLFDKVRTVWHDTKLDFKNRDVLRKLLSEMEVAEYWYVVKNDDEFARDEYKFKVKVFSPESGDELIPVFDSTGDMIAFCRGFVSEDDEGRSIDLVDIFTKDRFYYLQKGESGYFEREPSKLNTLKKIPIVYYRQDAPEWNDVQTTCNRQETLVSNFSDTNDYFASPMIKAKGKVKGFADKGEQGKIITVDGDGDVSYLTWDSGPEAIKTEFDNNEDLIFGGLQLPNISFSKMKSIGNNNNALMKLLFSDPHMKAETKWELFGIGVQRRLNIISRLVALTYDLMDEYKKLSVVPEMEPYLPKNITEEITALVTATGGEKVMSQKRGVELNPMVENSSEEIERVEEENVKAMESAESQI